MFVTSQALRDGFANQEKASEILDHFHVASRRCLVEGNLIDEDVDFASIVRERYEEYYQASQGRCEPLVKLVELFFCSPRGNDNGCGELDCTLHLSFTHVSGRS
jgi:hypothetical protein